MKQVFLGALSLLMCGLGTTAIAADATPGQSATTKAAASATVPANYVIGPGDVLSVVFWRDKDMSVDVVVRPDGKISMPLLNEVDASGQTPEQLRVALTAAAGKLIEEPNVTVVIKEIHSRNVYITGNVAKSGPYPLHGELNVLQLISMAGGLAEYADSKSIVIMRTQNGKNQSFKFNYKDVIAGKKVEQNIQLAPGDQVVVP